MSKNPLNSEKKQNIFVSSSQELKKVPALAACAMFAALAMILNSVASISIGPYIKIGFSAIPNQLVDYLFGPVTGSLFAGVLDIVKYVLKPDGAFFFGFTFNAMLAAFIYGCFYYKKKTYLMACIACKADCYSGRKRIPEHIMAGHAVRKRFSGSSSGPSSQKSDHVAD